MLLMISSFDAVAFEIFHNFIVTAHFVGENAAAATTVVIRRRSTRAFRLLLRLLRGQREEIWNINKTSRLANDYGYCSMEKYILT